MCVCVRAHEREVAPLAIICMHFSTHIAILFIYLFEFPCGSGWLIVANVAVKTAVSHVCVCLYVQIEMAKCTRNLFTIQVVPINIPDIAAKQLPDIR